MNDTTTAGARDKETEGSRPATKPSKPSAPAGPNQSANDEIAEYLRLGGQDPNGRKVAEIYWTTRKYQIYSDGIQVRCVLPDGYNAATALREKLYVISTERARIENLREHMAVRARDKEFAARMLARCMAQAFEGHADRALPILQRLEGRMASSIAGHYRMKYVFANASAVTFIVLLLLALIALLPYVSGFKWFPLDATVLDRYAKLSIFGAVGAFLSVSIGIRQIHIDVDLRPWEHIYAGCARIIIGVIGAIIMGLALDSKFLSPSFGGELSLPVYYLLAIVAGFSETLVPNTLRRAEDSGSQPRDETNGGTDPPPADAEQGGNR